MGRITFEVVQGSDIEQCRELCDELMAYQRSKARLEPERFDPMNFDTRMRKSYDAALDKQVVVVKDNGTPVGYVFSTIELSDNLRSSPLRLLPHEDMPPKVGCLSNLYLREGYRGTGIGSKLFDMSMKWLDSFNDIDRVYVFISNGNDEAYSFYRKHGFTHSHEVLGGFITAMCRLRNDPSKKG